MYLLTPEGGLKRTESVWDERDCDRQKALLAAGADANESGSDGLTPLMNAARMGEPDCVTNLIAAGARLETADKDGDTALGQAIVAGRDDNVAILRAAGASDFRITEATGEPVEDGAAPLVVVTDYIAAVHRGDFETMARLKSGTSVELMEARRDDLPMWQSLRPKTHDLVSGWMTGTAATLIVRGATPSGEQRVNYHLENGAGRLADHEGVVLVFPEGLRPSDSPTASLARRFAARSAPLARSRCSLARSSRAVLHWLRTKRTLPSNRSMVTSRYGAVSICATMSAGFGRRSR